MAKTTKKSPKLRTPLYGTATTSSKPNDSPSGPSGGMAVPDPLSYLKGK